MVHANRRAEQLLMLWWASLASMQSRLRRIETLEFERPAIAYALAKALSVPAYVVLPDRSLLEIACRRPATPGEMGQVHGIEKMKLARFGEVFWMSSGATRAGKGLRLRREQAPRELGAGWVDAVFMAE